MLFDRLEPRRFLSSVPSGFSDSQIGNNVDHPTSMTIAPDGRIFVCEQAGRLRVIKNGTLLSSAAVTLPTHIDGSEGLLNVALDPSFSSNGFIYLFYTRFSGSTAKNRVSRFTMSGDKVVSGSEKLILETPTLTSTQHPGSAMAFGSDGKFYVAIGDNFTSSNSQTKSNIFGKILRLNKDGTIPSDNPFYSSTSGQNRAIFALGLRNPFTGAMKPGTSSFYINDVGDFKTEELNVIARGKNYGWPLAEGPSSNSAFTNPIYSYNHASRTEGASITGGAFYNPTTQKFPSSYSGDYFFGDYTLGTIRVRDSGGSVSTFATGLDRITDVEVGKDGNLYYLLRGFGTSIGEVHRVTYNATATAPTITVQPKSQTVAEDDSVTFSVSASGSAPLSYQWQRNGSNISGATSSSFTINTASVAEDNGDTFRCIVSNSAGSKTSNSATLTVIKNTPPVPQIISPAESATYTGGMTINFSGSATDAEDGTLPASAFTWEVVLHHDMHTHPFYGPVSGIKSGSFVIPTNDETSDNVFYHMTLTVRDSNGTSRTIERDILPVKSTFSIDTNVAGITGITLDGEPITTPTSTVGVVGIKRTLGAPLSASMNGTQYTFTGWSDGGAAMHDIFTPASDTNYIASYAPAIALNATADTYVNDGANASANFGSTTTLLAKKDATPDFDRQTLLKFDISSLSSVSSAKLRLFGKLSKAWSTPLTIGAFSVADPNSWDENSVTFATRPAESGSQLATATISSTSDGRLEWDISAFIAAQKAAGAGVVSIMLTGTGPASPYAIFQSRETGNGPQLVVSGA